MNLKVFKAIKISFLAFVVLLSTISSLFAPVASAADGNIYVSSTGSDIEGTGTEEAPVATIEKALEKVDATGTIILQTNITQESTLAISSAGKNMTITSAEGHTYSIIRGESFVNGNLIQISGGNRANSVTFEKIIIDGNHVSTNGQIYGISSAGGTVNFKEAEIKNHIVKASASQPATVISTSGGVRWLSSKRAPSFMTTRYREM